MPNAHSQLILTFYYVSWVFRIRYSCFVWQLVYYVQNNTVWSAFNTFLLQWIMKPWSYSSMMKPCRIHLQVIMIL